MFENKVIKKKKSNKEWEIASYVNYKAKTSLKFISLK